MATYTLAQASDIDPYFKRFEVISGNVNVETDLPASVDALRCISHPAMKLVYNFSTGKYHCTAQECLTVVKMYGQ